MLPDVVFLVNKDFQKGYVMPGVCLFCLHVCLLATLRKTTDHIFMKLLPEMYHWKRKIYVNF